MADRHYARILIESARFPPFVFDITEISSDGVFVTLDGACDLDGG